MYLLTYKMKYIKKQYMKNTYYEPQLFLSLLITFLLQYPDF